MTTSAATRVNIGKTHQTERPVDCLLADREFIGETWFAYLTLQRHFITNYKFELSEGSFPLPIHIISEVKIGLLAA